MMEFWATTRLVIFGFILGIVGSIIIEWVRRRWKKKDEKSMHRNYFKSYVKKLKKA